METPGDAANIAGMSITGVPGPSGCVRSTTFSRPAARSSTSCVSVVATSLLRRASSALRQIALKLKAILEQRQACHVARRADRVDLCDDRREIACRVGG